VLVWLADCVCVAPLRVGLALALRLRRVCVLVWLADCVCVRACVLVWLARLGFASHSACWSGSPTGFCVALCVLSGSWLPFGLLFASPTGPQSALRRRLRIKSGWLVMGCVPVCVLVWLLLPSASRSRVWFGYGYRLRPGLRVGLAIGYRSASGLRVVWLLVTVWVPVWWRSRSQSGLWSSSCRALRRDGGRCPVAIAVALAPEEVLVITALVLAVTYQ